MPKLAELKAYFQKKVNIRDTALAEFKTSMDKDPVHAFSWSEHVMQTTAQAHVCEHFLASITFWEERKTAGELEPKQPQTEEAMVEFLYTAIVRQALQRGRYVERSTSVCGNFMKSEETAFYSSLASDWEMLYA